MIRKQRMAYEECGAQAVVVLNGSSIAYCAEHAKAYCDAEGIIIEEDEHENEQRQSV